VFIGITQDFSCGVLQELTAVSAVLLRLAIQFSKSELLSRFSRGRGFYPLPPFDVKGRFAGLESTYTN
jgi:hypothetical protein